MLCWWGIFVLASPFIGRLIWLAISGPIYITGLLLFVTGIPPLEKRYDQQYGSNLQYQQYKKTVSLLIPWPKIKRS